MIDAKELRVGNWIMVAGTGELHPIPAKVSDISVLFYNPELAGKIPLTYEILEKCGFSKTNGFIWNVENDRIADIYDKGDFRIHAEVSRGVFYTTQPKSIDYKYVHQLQNLYFILTGTELEIKL